MHLPIDPFGLSTSIDASTDRSVTHGAVCVRRGDGDRPLFFTSTFENISHIHLLALHIDESIPIYLLPIESNLRSSMRTVEGIATTLVAMLRRIQPDGPYRMIGHSIAGVIAYEIAAQLIGADQLVSFIGLLGPACRPNQEFSEIRHPSNLYEVANCLDVVSDAEGLLKGQAITTDEVWPTASAALASRPHEASLHPITSDGPPRQVPLQCEDFENQWNSMVRQYAAPSLSIPIYCFTLHRSGQVASFHGWEALFPEVEFRNISILESDKGTAQHPDGRSLGRAITEMIRISASSTNQIPERSYDPLLTLQTGKSRRPPLFCIPGAGADVTSFIELNNTLGDSWSIYGLRPRGMDGLLSPYSTVSLAAAAYLRAINRSGSPAPVHILGHSFGGWVAFELALNLVRNCNEPRSITILDSKAPDDSGTIIRECNMTEVAMRWLEMIELILDRTLNIAREELIHLGQDGQIRFIHKIMTREKLIPGSSHPDILKGPLRAYASANRTSYVPTERYTGKILLALADRPKLDKHQNMEEQMATLEGWRKWAPNITYIHVPGNHLTLLKPPIVSNIARILEDQ